MLPVLSSGFLFIDKRVCSIRFFKMLVNVTEGALKGEKLKNALTSEEFYSFKGIPFAKPPVGPLRFKNPVPPEKYEGVRDATQERSPCVQRDFYSGGVDGAEDCLYLNVYTPKLPEEGSSLKPVMFYLYGGGCTEGQKDSFLYGPDFLVAKDVVLVVPNYRLHIFGFLNLGIDECPGNTGFKDQVAALSWTKQNISQFGGDPNNITIFGESAGAISVQFLLHSPLSCGKGLFHKAIIQSGSIIHDNSFLTLEKSIERASQVAKNLGFESKDPHELYSFLMKVPALDLATNALQITKLQGIMRGDIFPFLPSVENAGVFDERMVIAKGSELMKQDPGVPIMIGLCNQEALLSMKVLITEQRPIEDFISRIEAVISRMLQHLVKDEETQKRVNDSFKEFYFQGKSSDEEIKLAAIDIFSDMAYSRGAHDSIKALVDHSSQPVYSYLFSYRAKLGILEYIFNYNRPSFLKGAGHTDELGYLFHMILNKDKPSIGDEVDRKMIEHMTTIWTNFAKYSNPSKDLAVDFKPVSSADKSYLLINEELTIVPGSIFEERMEFIDGIYASLTSEPTCCISKK